MSAICLGCASSGNATRASQREAAENPQVTLQLCVNEWNLMNPTRFAAVIAAVTALPRCTVTLPQKYTPVPGQSCSRGDTSVVARTVHCLARDVGFICRLNKHRAYECPEHGSKISVATWNARLTTSRILTLNRPPHPRPPTSPPGWTTRYPHADGFIIPWIDSTGRLRKGLTLAGSQEGPCAGASDATNAPTALRCYGQTRVFDPCFPSSRRWSTGKTVAACAEAPGSTRFVRFRITRAVSR